MRVLRAVQIVVWYINQHDYLDDPPAATQRPHRNWPLAPSMVRQLNSRPSAQCMCKHLLMIAQHCEPAPWPTRASRLGISQLDILRSIHFRCTVHAAARGAISCLNSYGRSKPNASHAEAMIVEGTMALSPRLDCTLEMSALANQHSRSQNTGKSQPSVHQQQFATWDVGLIGKRSACATWRDQVRHLPSQRHSSSTDRFQSARLYSESPRLQASTNLCRMLGLGCEANDHLRTAQGTRESA